MSGWTGELPQINLYHLSRLTDETGILQHAVYTLPNYDEGYTTDDNARALTLAIFLEELGDDWYTGAQEYASRYLAFLWFAYHRETGRFRNFMGYNREWLEKVGSEDSHGRALLSLGVVCGRSIHEPFRAVAHQLFIWALPSADKFTSPRAWAFTLLGIAEYLRRYREESDVERLGRELSGRLVQDFRKNHHPDWRWFEPYLTYANARLPQALLVTGEWMEQDELIDIGLDSLNWLAGQQRSQQGWFSPIGNKGFYFRGKPRAGFDQQPIEAASMVSASIQAFLVTKDPHWKEEAGRSFRWFLGENDLQLPLYDPLTGGCKDGLQPDSVNQNQGAESTLAFLLALLEIRLNLVKREPPDPTGSQINVLPVNLPEKDRPEKD